jgi:hypothetical protein
MSEFVETGVELEFVVSELAWAEPTANGTSLRMCFADRIHGKLVAKYIAIVEMRDLARMLKSCETAMSNAGVVAWGMEDATAH